MTSWTFDVAPDAFGICDGRVIAQALIVEAVRQIMPYVNNEPEATARMMRALVQGAAEIVVRETRENGGPVWAVHYDGEIINSEAKLIEALKRHTQATMDLTDALIERGALLVTN